MAFRVAIEHCWNCDLHKKNTHHNEQKYLNTFAHIHDQIKSVFFDAVVLSNPGPGVQYIPIEQTRKFVPRVQKGHFVNRLTGERVQYPRLGSFEVWATVWESPPELLFSKLSADKFPTADEVLTSLRRMVKDVQEGKNVEPSPARPLSRATEVRGRANELRGRTEYYGAVGAAKQRVKNRSATRAKTAGGADDEARRRLRKHLRAPATRVAATSQLHHRVKEVYDDYDGLLIVSLRALHPTNRGSDVLYSYGLDSYGLCSYGLCSYGLLNSVLVQTVVHQRPSEVPLLIHTAINTSHCCG